jgi:methyl-accepting chemotaxis protein
MAKTVTLTVKVDDSEFQRFVGRFNAFSAQIGHLNAQFKSINTTMQKTQSNAQTLVSTFQNLHSVGKSFLSIINESVKGFMKMAVLVGSLGATLSTGVGMFGLDRLAASILQKRRQAMGMGTDYGAMEGARVGGQPFMEDPLALIQSIKKGLSGSPEELGGLAGLGVRIGPGAETDPMKVVGTVIRNLYDKVHGQPVNQVLPIGRGFRGGLAISDEFIIRLAKMSPKEREEYIKNLTTRIKEPSKEAQEGWTALSQAFERAKSALESAFGERLKTLTPHLEQLSKGVTNLVTALLDSGTVAKILNWITRQLTKVTQWLNDPKKVKEALEKLDKEFNNIIPILKLFKEALLNVWDVMTKIYDFFTGKTTIKDLLASALKTLIDEWKNKSWKDLLFGKEGTSDAPNPARQGTGPNFLGQYPRDIPSRDANFPGNIRVPNARRGAEPAPQATPATPAAPAAPATSPPADAPVTVPNTQGNLFMGGSTQMASLTGGSAFGGTNIAAFGGAVANAGDMSFAARSQGGNISLAGGSRGGDISVDGRRRGGMFASISGGNRIAMFGGAARGRVPGNEMNAFIRGDRSSNLANIDARRNFAMSNPLDVDNWQSTRVSSLVIRNVPGANMFTQATGMAG